MLRTLTFREFTPPETAEGTVSEGITAIQTERNQLRQQQTEIRSSLKNWPGSISSRLRRWQRSWASCGSGRMPPLSWERPVLSPSCRAGPGPMTCHGYKRFATVRQAASPSTPPHLPQARCRRPSTTPPAGLRPTDFSPPCSGCPHTAESTHTLPGTGACPHLRDHAR